MEQYNDDERVDDLKKWWKENGSSIIAGIVLGLIAIFGWQYWNSYRDAQAEKVSLAYDEFIEAMEKPDAEQARQRGRTLLTDFAKSSYAVLTALQLARLEVDEGDTAAAAQHLEWIIANARLGEFKDIARLRLARVRFAAGQPAEGRTLLEDVTTASLIAEREELKGDLYLAGGEIAPARAAYTAALAADGGSPLLQLKLDNLTPATAESLVAAPPPPPAVQPEPVEATETPEPMEPAEVPEPMEPAEAPEPMEPAEAAIPVEQPVAPAEAPEPMEPAAAIVPVEPADAPEPMEPAEAVMPVEQPVEPADAPEPVAPVKPVDSTGSIAPTALPSATDNETVPSLTPPPTESGQ